MSNAQLNTLMPPSSSEQNRVVNGHVKIGLQVLVADRILRLIILNLQIKP